MLQREGSLYLAFNDRNALCTSQEHKKYILWSCLKVCEALTFLLDNIYIRFGISYTDNATSRYLDDLINI